MEDVKKDKRFSHIVTDPRFKKLPKSERKVKIDQRFKSMFKDKKFKLKYSVDKRGRPVNLSTNENLRRYYDLGSDEDESSDDNDDDDDEANDDDDDVNDDEANDDVNDAHGSDNNESEMDDDSSDESDDDSNDDVESFKSTKNKLNLKPLVKSAKKGQGTKLEEKVKKKKKDKKAKEAVEKSKDIQNQSGEEDSDEEELPGVDSGIDFARGEGLLSSSSDEEDEDTEADTTGFDHRWGEVGEEVERVSESTSRLAVCNMDWDRIKAQDIFIILNSFKPARGLIKSVKIFLSEFGKERIAEENASGPQELRETTETNAESAEGQKYHTEKLRQYQLNRLKYYYAVVECDSAETADKIYTECDGTEYESSSTKLDLRFIPDEMEFDGTPTSECTDAPDRSVYKPSLFFNTALSQSKVELTWDETDRDRVLATQNLYTNTGRSRNKRKEEDLISEDLKAYLASSSDEEAPDYSTLLDKDAEDPRKDEEASEENGEASDSDEDHKIAKYKRLLLDIETKETKKEKKDVQMEISWEPGLKEVTEDLIKKKKPKDQTPWEEYLDKKKEKKKKKREEKQKKKKHKLKDEVGEEEQEEEEVEENQGTKRMNNTGEETQAFSDDDLPDDIKNDPFFAEELKYRQKNVGKKDKKKKKKKSSTEDVDEDDEEKKKREAELELLLMDHGDNKKHFNLKKLIDESDNTGKKKKKKKKMKTSSEQTSADDFQIDVNDARFAAVYDSHHFNIDPSAPEYKRTKGAEAIISEKLKRRQSGSNKKDKSTTPVHDNGLKRKADRDSNMEPVKKKSSADPVADDSSLASLVQSVKMKTQQFQNKKKR